MRSIVIVGVIMLIGFALLPGIKTAMTGIYNITNSTYNLTAFEQTTWKFMPLILLVFIFYVAIRVFLSKRFGSRQDDER